MSILVIILFRTVGNLKSSWETDKQAINLVQNVQHLHPSVVFLTDSGSAPSAETIPLKRCQPRCTAYAATCINHSKVSDPNRNEYWIWGDSHWEQSDSRPECSASNPQPHSKFSSTRHVTCYNYLVLLGKYLISFTPVWSSLFR